MMMPPSDRAAQTMCRITALALAVLLLCGCVSAKNLYPECDGDLMEKVVAAKSSATVVPASSEEGTFFSLTCFAHEVVSVKGNQKGDAKDYCKVAHQTEYPYELYVRASYKDDGGAEQHRDFSLRDIAGSSIDGVTIRMDRPSKFSVRFANTATSPECSLHFRGLLTYSTGSFVPVNGTDPSYIPTLVAVHPSTIYQGQDVTVVLQLPGDVDLESLTKDRTFTVPLKERCDKYTTSATMDADSVPEDFFPLWASEPLVYAARTRLMRETGSVRVCYENRGKLSSPFELAVVTSFGNNPAYYDIISGATAEGQVNINEPVTIKFFGSNLDTRPGGDKAKLVDEFDSCEDGRPAGGVPIGTDLGPSDNYGPNTTYSLWDIVIREAAGYKLCYLRAGGSSWAEVPYISLVDPGSAANTPSQPSVPTPRNPDTGDACPMAPTPEEGKAWTRFQSAKMTLSTSLSVEEILRTLQQLFCVTRNAVTITRLTHDKEGKQVAHFIFTCTNLTDSSGSPVCDNTERLNYAHYIGNGDATHSSLLASYKILSIVGSTAMGASGDDPNSTVGRGASVLWTLIIGATVVSSVAVAAVALTKYTEKRQYMVQFGMDDDIDDMYVMEAMPPAGTSGAAAAQRYELGPMTRAEGRDRPDAVVQSAVIEIED